MIEDCIETLTKGEVWEDKYLEYFWSNSILGGDADGGLFLLPWISRGNGTKCVGEYTYPIITPPLNEIIESNCEDMEIE